MNILIIASYVYPDTVIAARRISLFAKYLKKFGNNVTIVCPGIARKQMNNELMSEISGIDIISYCDKYVNTKIKDNSIIRKIFNSKVLKKLWIFRYLAKLLLSKINYFKLVNKCIYRIKNNKYDIILSTYSELENIWVGIKAKKIFNAPLIIDFRDLMINSQFGKLENYILYSKQKSLINHSDGCVFVSKDNLEKATNNIKHPPFIVINNGYDNVTINDKKNNVLFNNDLKLRFCYTGFLYYNNKSDMRVLFRAINELGRSGLVVKNNIEIHYAGSDCDSLISQAEEYNCTNIIINHNYLTGKELIDLQKSIDIFIVLSWCNKIDGKGIITGKFYDGIMIKKPILSIVSGDVMNSELFMMNNKYNYGFCYENARDNFTQMNEYILKQYNNKMHCEKLFYQPDKNLFTDFKYETLTYNLFQFMKNIL